MCESTSSPLLFVHAVFFSNFHLLSLMVRAHIQLYISKKFPPPLRHTYCYISLILIAYALLMHVFTIVVPVTTLPPLLKSTISIIPGDVSRMLYASLVRKLIWWQVVVVDIFVSGVSDVRRRLYCNHWHHYYIREDRGTEKIPSRIPT